MNFEQFLKAVKTGQLETVKSCLISHPEFLKISYDGYQRIPLHFAAEHGHESMVELLLWQADALQVGSIIDFPDRGEWTPLHLAILGKHESVVKGLIQFGASVNFQDGADQTPLHLAAWLGHKSIGKLLIRAGAFINSVDKFGRTPLHNAALNGRESMIKLLIRAGSTIDSLNSDAMTPLHLGAWWRRESIVRTLKAIGAAITSHPKLLSDHIEILHAPISEEEILEIRARIYFDSSLVSRLLF